MSSSSSTIQLQHWLHRHRAGDPSAAEHLLGRAADRLQLLTRKMLRGYPGVQRWAETDDVCQGALVRLLRALQSVRPESPRRFFALAAEQVRRELIDLARHFYGPEGSGRHHASWPPGSETQPEKADLSHEPARLAEWAELHRRIGELPEDEREVVGLLFYQGLTQVEAAKHLGISTRTVQRRWLTALVTLHGQWPAD